VEIAWVMAAAGRALVGLLGVDQAPLVSLSELQTGVIRVPWMGRLRSPEAPAFSVGLDGVEEEAAHIYLTEEREPVPGEPGSYQVLHLDEGGYRPGLHAVLRSAGSPVGHAVAAALAVALARETDGVVTDVSGAWIDPAGGPPLYTPEEFVAALAPARRYPTVSDAAGALLRRRPVRRPAPGR
jgi:hypothetical protein